jgi:hypothetical protein
MTVDLPRDALVELDEQADKGWSVTVDGHEARSSPSTASTPVRGCPPPPRGALLVHAARLSAGAGAGRPRRAVLVATALSWRPATADRRWAPRAIAAGENRIVRVSESTEEAPDESVARSTAGPRRFTWRRSPTSE